MKIDVPPHHGRGHGRVRRCFRRLPPDRRETRRSHSIASNIEHTKQTAPEIETPVAFVAYVVMFGRPQSAYVERTKQASTLEPILDELPPEALKAYRRANRAV